jgi:hypothetical protein
MTQGPNCRRRRRPLAPGVVCPTPAGFARVFCEHCKNEYLLPFSCKCRGICPSCDAKRAAAFAAFLKDDLLEDVCHAQWVRNWARLIKRMYQVEPLKCDYTRSDTILEGAQRFASVTENRRGIIRLDRVGNSRGSRSEGLSNFLLVLVLLVLVLTQKVLTFL